MPCIAHGQQCTTELVGSCRHQLHVFGFSRLFHFFITLSLVIRNVLSDAVPLDLGFFSEFPNTGAFVFALTDTYAFVAFGKPNTIKIHRVCCPVTKHMRVGCSVLGIPNTKKHETDTFPTHTRWLDITIPNIYAFVVPFSKHMGVCCLCRHTHARLLCLYSQTQARLLYAEPNTYAFGEVSIWSNEKHGLFPPPPTPVSFFLQKARSGSHRMPSRMAVASEEGPTVPLSCNRENFAIAAYPCAQQLQSSQALQELQELPCLRKPWFYLLEPQNLPNITKTNKKRPKVIEHPKKHLKS